MLFSQSARSVMDAWQTRKATTLIVAAAAVVAMLVVASAEEADIATVFDPNTSEGYQRRYMINVAAKAEECYFIESILEGQLLNFHFMVVNAGKNGQKLDISFKIKGPQTKVVNYQSRKNEGKLIGHQVTESGSYEVCFNNRYSYFEEKKVFWQFEIEGAPDEVRDFEKAVNASIQEFKNEATVVKKSVNMVRGKVARVRSQQWRIENSMKADLSRAEALQSMIDTWSIIHLVVVVCIGFGQVLVLRRLFNVKQGTHRISART